MSDYRMNVRKDVPDAESIESGDSLFGLFGGEFCKIAIEQLFRKFVEDDTVANSEITITDSEGNPITHTVAEFVKSILDDINAMQDSKQSKYITIDDSQFSINEIIIKLSDVIKRNENIFYKLFLKSEFYGYITDMSDVGIYLMDAPEKINSDIRGDVYNLVYALLNVIKKVRDSIDNLSPSPSPTPSPIHHTHSVDDIYKATTVGGSWNRNFANIVPDLADAISCNPDFVQYITEERNTSIEDFVEDYGMIMQGGKPVTDSSGNNWFILLCGMVNRTVKEKVAPKSSLYDMQYGNVVKMLGEVESAEDLDKVVLSASDKDVHFVLGDTAIDNLIITDKIELFNLLEGGLEPQSPEDVDALVAKYGNKVITISLQQANEDGSPFDVDGMSISDFYESDFKFKFMTQCYLIASEDIVAPIMRAESEEEVMSQFKFSIDEIEAESIFKTPLLKIVADASATAEQAQNTANNAQSTAESARNIANNAQSTANNAQSTANNAQSTAESTQNTAEQAQSIAVSAQSTANDAYNTANEAKSTADNAQNTAESALTAIAERYTNTEINNLVSSIPKFAIKVVNTLPVSNISTTTVYLLAKQDVESNNLYTEYIYVNNVWEKLGEQTVDLSDYYTKQQTDGQVQTIITTATANFLTEAQIREILDEEITTAIANKVSSLTIDEIEKITESDYKSLAQKDSRTFYAVVADEEEVVENA